VAVGTLRVPGTLTECPSFLKSSGVRSKTLETGSQRYTALFIPYLVRTSFYTLSVFVDESTYLIRTLQQPNGLFKNYADMMMGNRHEQS